MENIFTQNDAVLLIGNGDLTAGVALCLLNAGHRLTVYTENEAAFNELFRMHATSQKRYGYKIADHSRLNIIYELPLYIDAKLVIVLTAEDLVVKHHLLGRLNELLHKDAIVAINTESISLDILQNSCTCRLVGMNWTEPAHTTFFLEIITTEEDGGLAGILQHLAKAHWGKDPLIVRNDGIRSRLLSAMAREASFLVDNGYASVEDIDRACRNDAGYYLPFSGNCRYMDLMGTYAYGMVMKDLNPDLSKDQEIPEFFKRILEAGGLGIENKKGFYSYSSAAVHNWRKTMEKFSYQIHDIIEKYPFNYDKDKIKQP